MALATRVRLCQQVILSCSHVFTDKTVFPITVEVSNSYSIWLPPRRQTGATAGRHSNYQTRLIHDGRSHHRVKSAIKIQCWWRGVLVRRWYREARGRCRRVDVSLLYRPTCPALQVESCAQSSSAAEGVLAAADSALATARAAMRTLDCHAALSSIDWSSLQIKARETASTSECPICIAPLLPPQATPTGHAHRDRRRPISLLSCGHMLHQTCVSSLERFCTTDGELSLCPLCRAPYLRQTLNFIQ
ncbi:RING finger protein 32 [Geodia barretti]|uniref:RING finger protein 32 n=1 Tax=Geodia barretti TaxID=519541 RepID=A0AA35TAY3_GEOBA|nr:RING finger protein 32 [Geodia barretti]